ncbi:hypothetical protein OEZ86_003642 [Tetradesmus obliquus]|nr:hypothetical protein OEZ86_003642 [Tetradesmus obliquus]
MSVGQLCRLAFLASRLQQLANVTPLWQAAARQDLMVVAVCLARLRYYDADLMHAAAHRFAAAAQAQAPPDVKPAAAAAAAAAGIGWAASALQGIGLQPQLECPVPVCTVGTATPGTAHTTAGASSSSSSSSSSSNREAKPGACSSALMVDIGCLVPTQLLHTIDRDGLVQALQTLIHSSSNSSSSSSADLAATACGQQQQVLLAVEVDGPTHVAVNCWGHRLGSTVSRSWLLQQQGWVVLEVPWWQWEAGGL